MTAPVTDRIRALLAAPDADELRPGVVKEVLQAALDEIEWLRSHAGAVIRGPSFAEIAERVPVPEAS